jgi:ABC-type nitrate/sulfonate/bicarbonate transport system permease component
MAVDAVKSLNLSQAPALGKVRVPRPFVRRWAAAGLGVGIFLSLWLIVALAKGNATLLPAPAEVVRGLAALASSGVLGADVFASLRRVFGGFLLAGLLAVPLGLGLAYFQRLGTVILPIINLLRPIPPIAWIPLAILWFGIGEGSAFYITAVAAFFPIFLTTYDGGIQLDRQHIRAAASLGAGSWIILKSIYLPAAAPAVLTGLRIGLGQAWMAVVTAELIAAQSGLGFRIQLSRLNLETAEVIACMAVIGILGASMTGILKLLEKRLLPWHRV